MISDDVKLHDNALISQQALKTKDYLTQLIRNGVKNLTLDLTTINEVDVVGINTLATLHGMIHNKNGILHLVIMTNGKLHTMLHLTKFTKIFKITFK
jgi:anti-anti-sigma regulatory factor